MKSQYALLIQQRRHHEDTDVLGNFVSIFFYFNQKLFLDISQFRIEKWERVLLWHNLLL